MTPADIQASRIRLPRTMIALSVLLLALPSLVPTGLATDNLAPVADAGDDQSVDINQTVSFVGTRSHDLDGEIISYGWDFGDGTTATGPQAKHAYEDLGVYKVNLTVTDDEGTRNSDTVEVFVCPDVQAMIAEAATGTILRVPACEYADPIHVTKHLTLKGEGGNKTAFNGLLANDASRPPIHVEADGVTVQDIGLRHWETAVEIHPRYGWNVNLSLQNAWIEDVDTLVHAGESRCCHDAHLRNLAIENSSLYAVDRLVSADGDLTLENAEITDSDIHGDQLDLRADTTRGVLFASNRFTDGADIILGNAVGTSLEHNEFSSYTRIRLTGPGTTLAGNTLTGYTDLRLEAHAPQSPFLVIGNRFDDSADIWATGTGQVLHNNLTERSDLELVGPTNGTLLIEANTIYRPHITLEGPHTVFRFNWFGPTCSGSDSVDIDATTRSYENLFYLNQIGSGDESCHADLDVTDHGERNRWDTGNPIYPHRGLGSYWTDYEGNDTNGDGIGDTPYAISGRANASDTFPLVEPITLPPFPEKPGEDPGEGDDDNASDPEEPGEGPSPGEDPSEPRTRTVVETCVDTSLASAVDNVDVRLNASACQLTQAESSVPNGTGGNDTGEEPANTTYLWDLTGDGQFDATGSSVEWTYESRARAVASLLLQGANGTMRAIAPTSLELSAGGSAGLELEPRPTRPPGDHPNFVPGEFQVNPTDPVTTQRPTIRLPVTNIGSSPSDVDVRIVTNGTTLVEETVHDLAPGDWETVGVEDWGPSEGRHQLVGIVDPEDDKLEYVETDNRVETTVLVEPPRRDVSVEQVSVAPTTIRSDEQATVEVTLVNDGNVPTRGTARVLVDGEPVGTASTDREIAPGSTATARLDIEPPIGNHTITAHTVSDNGSHPNSATESEARTSLTVRATPPDLVLENLGATRTEAAGGGHLWKIEFTLGNQGQRPSGSITVVVSAPGGEEETVHLGGGLAAHDKVERTVTGFHNVEAGTDLTITASIDGDATTPGESGSEGTVELRSNSGDERRADTDGEVDDSSTSSEYLDDLRAVPSVGGVWGLAAVALAGLGVRRLQLRSG